jgi:putative membrane protein
MVAFTLMGIEGIADEIEQPFGTDASNLPLGVPYTIVCNWTSTDRAADTYCYDLKEEIE